MFTSKLSSSYRLDLFGQFYKSLYMNYTRFRAHQQPNSITLEEYKPTFHVQYASYLNIRKFRDKIKVGANSIPITLDDNMYRQFLSFFYCKTVARTLEEQSFVSLRRGRTAERQILTAAVQASHSTCLRYGFLELD
jgi:hypothetical protein